MTPALDLLPLVLDFFRLVGGLVVAGALAAAASPVSLGVVPVAALLGYGLFSWWRSVTTRLARGVRLRPFVVPTPVPLALQRPVWVEEGVAPGRASGTTPSATGFVPAAVLGATVPPAAAARPALATGGVAYAMAAPPPPQRSNGPTGTPLIPNGGKAPTKPVWEEESSEAPPPVKATPSRPPPPPGRFGWKLTGFFALFASVLLYFSAYLFDGFNRAVAALGLAIYWPLPWPGGGSVVRPLVTPDYIFLMYLGLFLAYAAAYLVSRKQRLRPAQRNAALLTAASYLFFAVLLDAFLESATTHPFLASLSLVARMLLGGLFIAILQFVTLVVPPPLFVERRFPRRRGAMALFFAAGAAAVTAALVLLYGAWLFLGIGRDIVPFAVLLLLPIYAYMFWVVIGRVLYRSELRARPVPSVGTYHPAVTIIIPAYQEEEGIEEAIRCADGAAGRYPGPVEILVGNDGSTDRTSPLAHAAIDRLRNAQGRVLDLAHGGKSNALNGMLRAARGEILVRVDADCRVDPDIGFGPMIRHFADPQVGAVQGMILPLQQTGWTRKLRLLEICFNHLFLRRAQMAYGAAQVVDGAFCAFRRSDLLKTGGWADWNGEDTEITLRLQRLGYRMRFEPAAQAREDVPANYADLKKQRIRWSRGGLFAHLRHYGSLFAAAPEFGGLALLVWIAMFTRGAMRHLIYLYALLATLLLALPTLYHLSLIIALLLVPRAAVFLYYLPRLGRSRAIPWISIWPATGALKQFFTVETFGTMLPGAIPEFSE
jgi:cellulose synthase/poly-beta-1,6-N-acetylglucosamine synthase-like glycosyltransferase